MICLASASHSIEFPKGEHACTPEPGADVQLSRIYGAERGRTSIRVTNRGAAQVYSGARQITSGDRIRMHLDVHTGRTVWVETRWDNDESYIVLNCYAFPAVPTEQRKLRSFPTLQGSRLAWVESAAGMDTTDIVLSQIHHQRLSELARFTLPGPVDWMDRRNERLQAIAFLPQSAEWLLVEIDMRELSLSVRVRSEHPLWVDARTGRIRRAFGHATPTTAFWAAFWLAGPQREEPFAHGDDHLGRLSNTAGERLLAMSHLWRLWPQSRTLQRRIRRTADRILAAMDHDGRVCSIKYSLDRATCIPYAHDVMGIHNALLSVLPALERQRADEVKRLSQRAFESYIPDFDGKHWRFPRCIQERFDGVPMPFNQQHRLALVAQHLAQFKGGEQYTKFADAALQALKEEWSETDYGLAWFYWPATFYVGWPPEIGLSCNTPSRRPDPPSVHDDSYHAAITAEFLLRSGEPFTRVEAITQGLAEGKRQWRLFMRSSADLEPPLWRNLPVGVLAATSLAKLAYATKVVLPIADFDNQMAFTGQAFSAAYLSAPDGTMTVEFLDGHSHWKSVSNLTAKDDLPAWWESNPPAIR